MCWVTNKKLKFKIAKENIPIYKICRKEDDKILSYFKHFEYRLGWLYETNFEVAAGTKMSEISFIYYFIVITTFSFPDF